MENKKFVIYGGDFWGGSWDCYRVVVKLRLIWNFRGVGNLKECLYENSSLGFLRLEVDCVVFVLYFKSL